MSCCCPLGDDTEHIVLNQASKDQRPRTDIHNEVKDEDRVDGYHELPDSVEESNRDAQAAKKKKIFCGYGLAFIGVLGISSGLACTQALDKSIPHSELNGFRFVAQLLITSPLLAGFRRCDVTVERPSVRWMVFGAFVLTLSSYMQYGSAYYLPLGVVSGVTRSCGLVMNYAISCVVNKTVLWYQFVAAILCIGGVTMVTQPKFLFPSTNSSLFNMKLAENGSFRSPCRIGYSDPPSAFSIFANLSSVTLDYSGSTTALESQEDRDSEIFKEELTGYILCVIEAVLSTVYIQLVSRKLSNVNIFVYSFWISIFGSISSFCIMAGTEIPVLPTVNVCIVFLIVHMLSAGTHNIILYRAYQLIDPVVAALILTLQIAFTFIFQYTLLSGLHPGRANALEISGAVIIFVGNALVPTYQALASACLNRKQTT